MGGKVRFYSWLQKGLALSQSHRAKPTGVPRTAATGIEVGVRLAGVADPIHQTMNLRGPGDVTGLETSQILRVEPKPATRGYEPNYFPFVEFLSPELPWLFSAARPHVGTGRLRPWLALVVLDQKADFEFKPGSPRHNPVLHIRSDAGELLPDPEQAFAWAHVQESRAAAVSPASLSDAVADDPSAFISRVMCPIQLRANTSYRAFLVPLFEAGRLAGLGLDVGAAGLADAWTTNTPSIELPVYHSWTFSTGQADFEELARKLKPYEAGDGVGVHDLDVGRPRGGLDLAFLGEDFADRESMLNSFVGALKSPIATTRTWEADHRDAFQDRLSDLLLHPTVEPKPQQGYDPLTQDPVVAPPLYGRWQAELGAVADRAELPAWADDVNMSPTDRAVSGVGSRVVRKHQEAFMAEAWDHARNVKPAQREITQSRMALAINRRIHGKLGALSDAGWLELTTSMNKVLVDADEGQTLHAELRHAELVPEGVMEGGFRRLSFRHQKVLAAASSSPSVSSPSLLRSVTSSCLDATDAVLYLAFPTPSTAVSLQKSYDVEETGSPRPSPKVPQRGRRERSRGKVRARPPSSRSPTPEKLTVLDPLVISVDKAPLKVKPIAASKLPDFLFEREKARADVELDDVAVRGRSLCDPLQTVPRLLQSRVRGVELLPRVATPIPKWARVTMAFSESTYHKLQAMGPELMLPGFGDIPDDTVTVLEDNPRFIEAYLLGLNHEMSREFAWREYPAALDGTWFKRFWDYLDETETDIEDIGGPQPWTASSHLGTHTAGHRPGESQPRIVVLIKGELLRRYPNTIVYAARAKWEEKNSAAVAGWGRYDGFRQAQEGRYTRVVDLSNPGDVVLPIFKGSIGSSATFLGFPLDAEDIQGSVEDPPNSKAGWFIVFEEQIGEPRFGLDAASPETLGAEPKAIDNLSWGHLAENESALEALTFVPLLPPWPARSIDNVVWGANGAEMARLTYQRPVRILFHGDALVADPT